MFAKALEKAKDADLVIMVAGTDSSTASEGCDRETLLYLTVRASILSRCLKQTLIQL